MKKKNLFLLTATLLCGLCLTTVSCSDDDDKDKSGQLLEVYGVKGTKGYTGGCIAFDEGRMIEIPRLCDLSLVITVSE